LSGLIDDEINHELQSEKKADWSGEKMLRRRFVIRRLFKLMSSVQPHQPKGCAGALCLFQQH